MSREKTVDLDSPIPYYVQLIEAIKSKIQRGEWKPGDQLPGEFKLCELYDVSRTVVRQALRELEVEGLIVRRKGKGTFVADPKINENLVQKLTGFYEDMVSRGLEPVTEVLKHQIIPAKAKIAAYLGMEAGEDVHMIERLRSVENFPIVLVTTYLPYHLCTNLMDYDLSGESLYAILEQEFGLQISHGTRTIEAVPANEREAELLEIPPGSPLILLNSVTFLEDGTPMEYYHAVHRGDRSRFVVELVRAPETEDLRDHIDPVSLPESN